MNMEAVTFRGWMMENFSTEELKDISQHGANNGWKYLSYTLDIEALYDKYESDIWEMLHDDAVNFGYKNAFELIAILRGAKDIDSLSQLKTLLIWYSAEEVAHRAVEECECEEQ